MWREKDYQSPLYIDTWRDREAEGDKERSGWTMSGNTWGRTNRLDQDGRGDQKQRDLEKSFKSLIVSSLVEERKEEEDRMTSMYPTCPQNDPFSRQPIEHLQQSYTYKRTLIDTIY